MNPVTGWALAALAVVVGWMSYGWRGVLLAATVTVFWLLLQFTRALRAMRQAGQSPVGRVGSAVMFNARLKPGLTLLQVIQLTRSLGERASPEGEEPERWRWTDDGGSTVTLELQRGRLQRWTLWRPPAGDVAQATEGSGPGSAPAAAPGDAGDTGDSGTAGDRSR